jgi:flagellar motor switch protein FliG
MTDAAQAPSALGMSLDGVKKAAVLLLALDRGRATKLLKRFEPEEIKVLSRSASALRPVSASELEALVEEFAEKFSSGVGFVGSEKEVRSLLAEAVGEEQLADLLADPPPPDKGEPIWVRLSSVKSETLRAYLVKEHPQTVAMILMRIESVAAAKIVGSFPPHVRHGLLSRMLAIRHVPDEAVAAVESVLEEDFGAAASSSEAHAGIANILNRLDKGASDEILRNLAQVRPAEAKALKSMLFTFEELVGLDPKERTTLLDQVPVERLILALHGTDAEFQSVILSSLASRSRRMVEAELQGGAPPSPREVADARRAIVDVVLRMAANGEIQLRAPEDENA